MLFWRSLGDHEVVGKGAQQCFALLRDVLNSPRPGPCPVEKVFKVG